MRTYYVYIDSELRMTVEAVDSRDARRIVNSRISCQSEPDEGDV